MKCWICDKESDGSSGRLCGRCDKIRGDAVIDRASQMGDV